MKTVLVAKRARHGIILDVALAFALYMFLALIFFARALPWHFFDYYVGRDTDPSLYMWGLQWWLHAIRYRLNPFFTDLVWAPYGINLATITSMPLVGVLAAPIEAALGPIATFNLLAILVLPVAAWSGYILCREIGARPPAALAGGFVFGFSPYMIGQLLSHFVLLLIFPVPLALCLVVRRFNGGISRVRFVILLALAITCEFLMMLEGVALMTFIGAIAIAIAIYLGSRDERRRLLALVPEIAGAYGITVAVMSPYLYQFFRGGFPSHPLWPPAQYSADLLNFVIPTPANALGDNAVMRAISSRFPGNIYEQGACLGLPLIAIAIAWTLRHRHELGARLLAAMLAISCVLAMGPYLQAAGRPLSFMPWAIVEHLPVLRSAMPVRLMPFAFLAAAMIFALWLGDRATGAYTKWAALGLTVILMLPNPAASFWASPALVPAFFTDGSSHRYLAPADIVLPLPFGQKGNDMLWQAISGMKYRMASGLTGMERLEISRWPLMNVFYGSIDLPDPELQVKAFIANTGITAIVADASDPQVPTWKALFAPLGVEPREISGVLLYRIPPGLLDRYRAYTAVEMERRAAALRFDAAISAAARYLRSGGTLDQISVPTLAAAGLFPPQWRFNPKASAFRDIWLIPVSGKPAIGVTGSRSAVQPIIDRYGAEADTVFFPMPRKWEPNPPGLVRALFEPVFAESASGEDWGLMLMVFAPDRLQQLAARIAPPPALSPASIPPAASRLSPSR